MDAPRMPPQDTADALARFIVGIDLGTTNSAVAYVDTADEPLQVRTFRIPQLVAAGEVDARETLPSFHYEPTDGERAGDAFALPWCRDRAFAVGIQARNQGESAPGRLIASAKSWLCHAGIDRTASLLPWHAADDVERLSPIEVSARLLLHVREAWDHVHPDDPLSRQDVVLTLPASFDEVARELTVKAAVRAGLPRVTLIEEPQAAFYAWIDTHGADWETYVRPGQKVLVCDVGGGTTDLTLIRVRRGDGGKVAFHRVAVGEHLILGGDNLDLALAHHVEARLATAGPLTPRQWGVLVQSCRRVKETLLGAASPEDLTLSVPAAGARLIGGGLQVHLTRDEVQQVLVEGFLPRCQLQDKPATRRSGFQEFGLPYAPDAAITRYLAAFLATHRNVGLPEDQPAAGVDPARPDVVLFNGGFFESPVLRDRLLEVLGSWFRSSAPTWQPLVLENQRLDLAVARGATYYGLVRRGRGVRISAGLARAYFIGVETGQADGPQAVCLAPAGIEEGARIDLHNRAFELLIQQPVEFPLYVSSTRLTDRPGDLVAVDREQLTPLPSIRTVLQVGKKSAAAETLLVNLHARLTEIGTLEIWCSEAGGDRAWTLQFDIRATTQTDLAAHTGPAELEGFVDDATYQSCRELLLRAFGPGADMPKATMEGLVKAIEQAAGMRRGEWPSSLLRRWWAILLENEQGRVRGEAYESRWLYLLGYCLRPGYGLAVDDWRVAQTWRLFQTRRLLHGGPTCRVEWLIMWRRIAGGLAAGQQQSIADPLLATVRPPAGRKGGGRAAVADLRGHEAAEVWRLLGSLELLPAATKIQLGNLIADRLDKEKAPAVREAQVWALGRLGARAPMYGPWNVVVPAEPAEAWLQRLMYSKNVTPGQLFAVAQLARRTDDRYRDVGPAMRDEAASWLTDHDASDHYITLVRDGGDLAKEEVGLMFGESLPRGLRAVQ